jgi:hypothetical protein
MMHVRQLGQVPKTPQVDNVVLAVGTFAAGLGAALGLVLLMQGRAKDAYPFAIGTAVTGAFLGAIKVLGSDGDG